MGIIDFLLALEPVDDTGDCIKTCDGGKIMKKSLARKITLSILAGAVLMSSSVVWAAVPSGWKDSGVALGASYYIYIPVTGKEGSVSVGGTYDVILAGVAEGTGGATGGKVTITDGNFQRNGSIHFFFGGYSEGGNASSNTVNISGVDTEFISMGDDIIIYGGQSVGGQNASVEENKVIISDGKFDEVVRVGGADGVGVEVFGGSASGSANYNEVKITNVKQGSFFKKIYGGSATKGATGNEVVLSAENATYNLVYGGDADAGEVKNNIVTISGGKFKDDNGVIYGGYSSDKGTVSGNTVNISGGVLKGKIYGGYSTNGSATNNIVNISGDADLGIAYLYGGASGSAETVSGNTLNIGTAGNDAGTGWAPTNGRTIRSIKGFDEINIYGVEWNEAQPHMTVIDVELKDTKINAYVSGELYNVTSKKMTLIDATNLTKASGATNYLHSDSKVNLYEGIANVYTGVVEVDETYKDVVIKLEEKSNSTPGDTTPQPERNNQVLVIGESRAAAVAFTNQGSELIETGLNALARDNEKDTKVFAAVYGNHSEYETGSHVNVNGWSGIVGIGKTNADGLTVGAFFENGEGNYSTHNIFTNDYIRGDGEACYNGGGFLVRKDNANGVYAEASLRAGNLQNELRNAVRNGSELTGYDIDTFYYGAHIGIGKVIPRGNDGDSLDVYGKFIYTHHDGETFDIGGTATKFDSVESERLRLGFRINEVQTNKLSMYYGAAWEYEFNGDAHDKIASFDLETPSLEGSTVIGEIGAHYKASEKWSIDLNGRAYVGQREGFSGSVQANYAF